MRRRTFLAALPLTAAASAAAAQREQERTGMVAAAALLLLGVGAFDDGAYDAAVGYRERAELALTGPRP